MDSIIAIINLKVTILYNLAIKVISKKLSTSSYCIKEERVLLTLQSYKVAGIIKIIVLHRSYPHSRNTQLNFNPLNSLSLNKVIIINND